MVVVELLLKNRREKISALSCISEAIQLAIYVAASVKPSSIAWIIRAVKRKNRRKKLFGA